jgi:hypothetical protein
MSGREQDNKRNPGPRVEGVNPNSDVDVTRLRESMTWSEKKLRPFRERYYDAVRYFAGNRYGNNTDLDKTPMNLLHLAVEIWLRQLAAQTPKSLVLTRAPDYKTSAFELQIATDYLLHAINFGESLSDVVRMAIFQMGIMKVGLTAPYMDKHNWTAAAGQPYAEPVLFEDWVHDMTARRREEWDWCGNRYRMPLEMVLENPDFSKSVRDKLRPGDQMESDGVSLGEKTERTSKLSASEDATRSDYREQVELIDIWIPGDNLFVTLPAQDGLMPLQVREWEGPEHGPYHILGFSKVPGNVVSAAPAQQVYDLQDLITRLFNQLSRQALRQKTLTIVDGRAEADGTAERIMEGQDGQVIRTSHIEGVKEMKYGGVAPENQQFLVYAREIFSYLGGNIDAMGGLAQQAGTLGQEELLVQSSSEMIRDMQAKVMKFTKEVTRDLAWYMYNDPFIELPLVKRIEGTEDTPFVWGPNDRKADFFNFSFDIQPYSLQHKGPNQRMQTIMGLMQNTLLPLAPQLEQMGVQLNLQKFVELVSQYSDLPELEDLIVTEMPTPYEELLLSHEEAAGGGGERPTQSPVTQRNYTRKNIPTGGTQQSRDAKLQSELLSAAGKQGA